uniref:Uncharacterized protein n=1 Tax=Chenopodium quinoa TaxID=63459 RepID=A0A803MUH2_CHEQI
MKMLRSISSPSATTRRYTGYYANGYRFYTKSRDSRCKTENSGVNLTAFTPSFAKKSEDENNNLSREDLATTVVNAKATLDDLDDLGEEIHDDSDYDDTLWDWMRAEDDDEDVNE